MIAPANGCAEHAIAHRPIVIGHRGACGYLPEHTLASYAIAIEQGADFVEPDLVMTRDGVPVARHENEIGGSTDVASHPEFSDRRTTKVIDGTSHSGWFSEDFTLAELKTLRARERLPDLRPCNARFDGDFTIPTFEEVLSLVHAANDRLSADARRDGRPVPRRIGVYPETKHPSYHAGLGLPMEAAVIAALCRLGFDDPELVYIQSFEVGNLKALRRLTRLPLVQLLNTSGAPYDWVVAGDARTYAGMASPPGLRAIATYADAIGVNKDALLQRNDRGEIGQPSPLIANAHDVGLHVHGWTFRAENQFLPTNMRRGNDDSVYGDLGGEITAFLAAGVDGFFTDQPNIGVAARDRFAVLLRRGRPQLPAGSV